MESRARETSADVTPEVPDLDGFTSYEDGNALVVCDRKNTNAWVRSDVTYELEV